MKHHHKRRLLKLCEFLEQLPRKRFDFSVVAKEHSCGTVGCAIGWTPAVFPRLVKWLPAKKGKEIDVMLTGGRRGHFYTTVAKSLFGINHYQAEGLFTPYTYLRMGENFGDGIEGLPDKATPKQVAKRLRQFLKLVEQDN